ncbi:MAG: hypothetical protein U0230_07680 [Polyangiales bacterium]
MSDTGEAQIARLRDQAERALGRNGGGRMAIPILDRILELADEGSEDALFAHRHLAEIELEGHPWRAALHLRKVIAADPDDDGAHAMMGLCQALLGHYRAAIGAYQRAIRCAPRIGWYHHNLGHLLDVALDRPEKAESHLRMAHSLAGDHDEVLASLAHCLGRLGHLDEARALGRKAVDLAPRKRPHRDLLVWLEKGAPTRVPESSAKSADASRAESDERAEAVRVHFEGAMRAAGYDAVQRAAARKLWEDFSDGRRLRVVKPAVYAAAVEYAIALLHERPGTTQASVARRYGVAPASVGTRYSEIRDALSLLPSDPRYLGG